MTRRGKIVLAVLVVGSALGLVAATNAWFVAVNNTPPGAINSALVRWLPEAGERSFTSILTYGNLISGSGVDPDGVPLVLPGNPLIANVATDGTSTVRTSIARAFETGETVDTVIHWEVREGTREDGSKVELVQKQRDLMDAQEPVDKWYKLPDLTTAIDDPKPVASDYTVTTTTSGGAGVPGTNPDGVPTTTTTTVVTTTYTALKTDAHSYEHIVTTTKVVTHAEATIAPEVDESVWNSATPVLTAQETVLWVRDTSKDELASLPTRSYLIITPQSKINNSVIPLALGNLSTVDTNVRIGINSRLTAASGNITPLTLSSPKNAGADGSYYLGTTIKGKFIELIEFRPYSTSDTAATKYHWAKVTEDGQGTGTLWSLWDLTVNGKTTVPAVSTAEPTLYTVTDTLRIVSKRPDTSMTASDAEFETLFNELYCDDVPTITLHLSYYVRQSEFMDWTEFYSQDIDLSMPQ